MEDLVTRLTQENFDLKKLAETQSHDLTPRYEDLAAQAKKLGLYHLSPKAKKSARSNKSKEQEIMKRALEEKEENTTAKLCARILQEFSQLKKELQAE